MDVPGEVIKVVFSALAKASIDKLIKRVERKDADRIDPQIVRERLKAHARDVSSVKTLLSTESRVSIDEFYCVPSVTIGSRRHPASKSSVFREDHILIEGVAGQGKSILLRHLCAKSILDDGKIAIFYELRRLDPLKPLAGVVFDSLIQFGLPGNAEALRSLSVERDVELYLDGFDELTQKEQVKIDRDLSYFATNFPFVRVFVSARPHVGLGTNAILTTYRVAALDKRDAYRMIDKLCREPKLAPELKSKLDNHKGSVTDLLETPLLVTLLVAKYSQTHRIPEQLSDFYADIFQTLFEKHDNFKIPFHRTRRLEISTQNYEKAFERFCFVSLFVEVLTAEKAEALAKWALDGRKLPGQPHDLLCDISDISSLIHDEAGVWSFIHNSVQEFYAAEYLLAGTDEEVGVKAGRLVGVQNAATKEQIFRFACEVDEFRYRKFVELPFRRQLASPLVDLSEIGIDSEACRKWLEVHVRDVVLDKNKTDGGCFFSVYTDNLQDTPIRLFAPTADVPAVKAAILRDPSAAISELFAIPVVNSRLTSEASKRLIPLIEGFLESQRVVESLADERRRSEQALADLLGEQF
jgi:hypothetical protein